MNKRVSILGCGWLGLPLAKFLIGNNFTLKGSTTSEEKLVTLSAADIEPYLMECNPELTGENIQSFFDSDILFLNIPFRRSLDDPRFYQKQIQSVISCVEQSPIKKLIFASSTSVYPDDVGEALEDKVFVPANERAQVLFDIENELLVNKNFATVILRFAGLYGGGRQIGQFMAGKKSARNGSSPVNLVHLDDCINSVHKIIQHNIKDEVLNVCSDQHPLRKDLYEHAARTKGLELPTFSEETSTHKIVSNVKLKKMLNYAFIHPDPMEL